MGGELGVVFGILGFQYAQLFIHALHQSLKHWHGRFFPHF